MGSAKNKAVVTDYYFALPVCCSSSLLFHLLFLSLFSYYFLFSFPFFFLYFRLLFCFFESFPLFLCLFHKRVYLSVRSLRLEAGKYLLCFSSSSNLRPRSAYDLYWMIKIVSWCLTGLKAPTNQFVTALTLV